jgi:hypothetical protein
MEAVRTSETSLFYETNGAISQKVIIIIIIIIIVVVIILYFKSDLLRYWKAGVHQLTACYFYCHRKVIWSYLFLNIFYPKYEIDNRVAFSRASILLTDGMIIHFFTLKTFLCLYIILLLNFLLYTRANEQCIIKLMVNLDFDVSVLDVFSINLDINDKRNS